MEDKDFGFLDLSLTSKRPVIFVPIHEPIQEFVQSIPFVYDQSMFDQ